MRTLISLLATVCVFGSGRLPAQDAFNVEYICGKSGFKNKVKGQLVVTDTQVSLVGMNGSPIFAIPAEGLGDAFSNAEGRTLLGFCTNKGEVVYLYTEVGGNAEAIAFKTEKGISQRIVARIHSKKRPAPAMRPDS
jgi:hypothetical protein